MPKIKAEKKGKVYIVSRELSEEEITERIDFLRKQIKKHQKAIEFYSNCVRALNKELEAIESLRETNT